MKTKFIILLHIIVLSFFSNCDFGIGELPDDRNSGGHQDYSWGGCYDLNLVNPYEQWYNHYFSVLDSVGAINRTSAVLYITIYSDETDKSDTTIFIQNIEVHLQSCNTGDICKVCPEDYSKPLDSCDHRITAYKCPLVSDHYSYEERVHLNQYYYDFETPVFCLEPQKAELNPWAETNYTPLEITKDASIKLCININGLEPNRKYVGQFVTEASISIDSTNAFQYIGGREFNIIGMGYNEIEFRTAK
jgi:hypothetical protein